MKKLKLLTVIPTLDGDSTTTYTAYFFNKREKYLLPISLPYSAVDSLLAKNLQNSSCPHVHDTVKQIITSLNGKITDIKIHLFQDGVFYTYICLKNRFKTYEINANLGDALGLAIRFKAAIFIKEDVLEKCGFTVTKEMVERALLLT